MLYAGNLDGSSRGSGQGGQQDPPQAVAQGGAVSALQRLYHILAVGCVFRRVNAFDARLFNFYHIGNTLLVTAIENRK